MVEMCRPKTSHLRDSKDTRRLMQHALRSPVGRKKSNAVGILLADNAHGCPNGDPSMSGVPRLLLNMDLLKETRELTTIAKEKHKMKMERYYNLKVQITILKPGYLVYRSNEANKKEDSKKLGSN
ncbi:hypothetical protein Tco_0593023 [Tanacetum coccineum]